MPRRVYSATLTGDYGQRWTALADWAALGGVILFVSALCFLIVVVATWTTGRRVEAPAFDLSVPLRPVTTMGIWDRFGLWTLVAIVLVALAYGYPLLSLLATERFGSPAYQPF
jgi:cytochrome c oxidase subunit 1